MRILKVDKICKLTTLKTRMDDNLDHLGQTKKKIKTE
jgi:hypothetical protein